MVKKPSMAKGGVAYLGAAAPKVVGANAVCVWVEAAPPKTEELNEASFAITDRIRDHSHGEKYSWVAYQRAIL